MDVAVQATKTEEELIKEEIVKLRDQAKNEMPKEDINKLTRRKSTRL